MPRSNRLCRRTRRRGPTVRATRATWSFGWTRPRSKARVGVGLPSALIPRPAPSLSARGQPRRHNPCQTTLPVWERQFRPKLFRCPRDRPPARQAPRDRNFQPNFDEVSGRLSGSTFRRSEHDRISRSGIGRLPGDPVIVRCKSEHHGPNCRIVSLFGQRPHFFGSHAPVRCVLEWITRVRDALASQMAFLRSPQENRYQPLFGAANPSKLPRRPNQRAPHPPRVSLR
jgi:hypothetical protein